MFFNPVANSALSPSQRNSTAWKTAFLRNANGMFSKDYQHQSSGDQFFLQRPYNSTPISKCFETPASNHALRP